MKVPSSFKLASALLIAVVLIVWANPAEAQCVMCKAVAEDSAEDGGLGAGLNKGILYLMAVPYVLLSALFFVIYKKISSSIRRVIIHYYNFFIVNCLLYSANNVTYSL